MSDLNEESPMSKKRLQYSMEFKKQVADFATRTNNSKAAERFGVARQCVQNWKRIAEQIENEVNQDGAKRKRIEGGGRPLEDVDFDEKSADWVRDKRQEKQRVTRRNVQAQARILKKDSNFKSSNGWLQKFLKRHNFVTRKPTTVCQKPPEEFTEKIVKFILYVDSLKKKTAYTNVFAADETCVFLDFSSSRTVDMKGVRQVPVKSTGHDKLHVTVMLTARSDGFKVRPFVLLPNKRPIPAIISQFRQKLLLSWCGRTFFNDEITEDYLRSAIGAGLFGKKLLVWDAFRCHISDGTKKVLKELNVETAVIPGGCTKFIQAPDVYWNSVFKSKIKEFYEEWMLRGLKTYTKSGNMRAPGMDVYLNWISDAWDSLSPELIKKSFVGCGLNNASDGSDDANIHCFKENAEIPGGIKVLERMRAERDVQQLEEILDGFDIDTQEEEEDVSFLAAQEVDNEECDDDSDASIDIIT